MNDPLRCPRPPPAPTVILFGLRSTPRRGRVASPRIGPRLRPPGTGPEPGPGGGGSLAVPGVAPLQPARHRLPVGNVRDDSALGGPTSPRTVTRSTAAWASRRVGPELTGSPAHLDS